MSRGLVLEAVKPLSSPKEIENLRQRIRAKRKTGKPMISVCASAGCVALGASRVLDAFKAELEKQGQKDKVEIKQTGCLGFCEQAPIVTIYPDEICYFKVRPDDVPEILSKSIDKKQVVKRLLYKDPVTGRRAQRLKEIPFYKYQLRTLLECNSKIDPKKIEDYIALDGYDGLVKALFKMTPQQVIDEVKDANLRGRGGGGFPTWLKWETSRKATEEPKYVIANCSEGDPGSFMDRSLMEANPHSILEGLIIGGYAIGSHEGYIYVKDEYGLAVENISKAIMQAEEYGLLGENILRSGFSFKVTVHKGAGAFVSGESSALMTAIEGNIGEPRPKYIHTAVKGIRGRPSCLNNVKTWANVPLIILKGSDWFRSIGTKCSSGTAIFSLAGKINNTGLVEVPMGTTLRDVIYKVGGGIRGGKRFKAVQIGGPSGGFIPEQYLDLQVDFDEVANVGSMMGGAVVMDEDTCMVDAAGYFVDFLLDESCGKCIPCREGLRVLSKTLNTICEGEGTREDMQIIEDVAETMRDASLCALGTNAANPVLTSLKYFRDEWEQHLKEKRCPAKACKALTKYCIDPKKCQACLICLRECPAEAIQGEKDKVHWIDQERCTKCGVCYEVCSFDSVKKLSGEPVPSPPPKGMRPIRKRGG